MSFAFCKTVRVISCVSQAHSDGKHMSQGDRIRVDVLAWPIRCKLPCHQPGFSWVWRGLGSNSQWCLCVQIKALYSVACQTVSPSCFKRFCFCFAELVRLWYQLLIRVVLCQVLASFRIGIRVRFPVV